MFNIFRNYCWEGSGLFRVLIVPIQLTHCEWTAFLYFSMYHINSHFVNEESRNKSLVTIPFYIMAIIVLTSSPNATLYNSLCSSPSPVALTPSVTSSTTLLADFSTMDAGALTPSIPMSSVSKTAKDQHEVRENIRPVWEHTQSAASRNGTHIPISIPERWGNSKSSLLANTHIKQILIPSAPIVSPTSLRCCISVLPTL
jgi:hypothetical protein